MFRWLCDSFMFLRSILCLFDYNLNMCDFFILPSVDRLHTAFNRNRYTTNRETYVKCFIVPQIKMRNNLFYLDRRMSFLECTAQRVIPYSVWLFWMLFALYLLASPPHSRSVRAFTIACVFASKYRFCFVFGLLTTRSQKWCR